MNIALENNLSYSQNNRNYQNEYINNSMPNLKNKKYNEIRHNDSYNIKSLKPRIQIMNNNPLYNKNINKNQSKVAKGKKYGHDISQYNLLNYYSDSNNDRMTNIKIIPLARLY